ncbi:MAG: hypothetical protein WA112_03470 [Rugosibacter sp.]|jgi:hypothetical protein
MQAMIKPKFSLPAFGQAVCTARALSFAGAVTLSLAASGAHAATGSIGGISIEPSPAKVGQPVHITVSAEGEAPNRCGLSVEFGDGHAQKIKINDKEAKFPLTLTTSYANPGTYTIKAEGKKITTHFHCMGEATATLVVEGTAKKAAPACPPGYSLSGKPDRLGAFRCKAGKGAKATNLAETPLNCPSPLEAYQTQTTVGCHAVKAPKK